MPCDDISEGALSEWNAKVIQNNGNWNALVFIGEAKIHLLSTYCDKNSKITKSRYATTYGLLGIAYLYTGDKASGCRSLQQASKYYSDIGNEDDLVNVKGAMRKAGC